MDTSDSGPWLLGCDLTDPDTAHRLKARFRAAAQKTALAAGAPYRVNRLDWWISKLTHGNPLPFIQDLIQRSAGCCEELETRALELGGGSTTPDGVGGLYRDRYPCDWGEPDFLYDGPPRSFSDPKTEFEWWTKHIWSGFNGDIAKLEDGIHSPRKREDKETQKDKDRVVQRVDSLYACMQRSILGLSYDLAVLQTNYIIDRGLRGDAAFRTFQEESAGLIESVRKFGREGSERLGLSYRRQEEGVDPTNAFREVGEDLRHLTSAMPAEAPSGISEAPIGVSSFAAAGTTKHEQRRAVVDPLLKAKGWTVNKWGTQAGVSKNCAYDYLAGKRNLSTANRLAMAQVLGLKAEDLPN